MDGISTQSLDQNETSKQDEQRKRLQRDVEQWRLRRLERRSPLESPPNA